MSNTENNRQNISFIQIKTFFRKCRAPLLSALLGMGIFLLLFGPDVLDPTFTDWYSSGDPGGHYFGWKLFREADWQVMVGMMDTANFPYSTSVVFTDSIPIAAIFFKLFRSLEPADFQYFGLWGFMCFALQGALSNIILKKYIRSDLTAVLASVFFIITPAFLRRMFWHTALASHWLILLGLIYFVWHFEKFNTPGRIAAAWALLGALCPLIHSYYLVICGIIAFTFAMEDLYRSRRLSRLFLPIISFGGAALIIMYILGELSSSMNPDAPGLGYYSFNLNSFFNSEGWSIILPKLKYYADGQFEGFSYLGAGILLLVVLALIYSAMKLIVEKKKPSAKAFFAALTAYFSIMFALSHEISLNSKLLLKLPISDSGTLHKLWQTFRSTGRVGWLAMYLIMLYAVVTAIRGWGDNARTGALIAAIFLILQLIDLSPGLMIRKFDVMAMKNANAAGDILKDDIWRELAKNGEYRHITFHNKEKLSQNALYAFADYAADNNMTINDFYFARAYDLKINQTADELAHNPPKGYIFIFLPKEEINFIDYPLEYTYADGFIIGTGR